MAKHKIDKIDNLKWIELLDIYTNKKAYTVQNNLYNLLQERTKSQSISHKSMPTFSQHIDFMHSQPYLYWFEIVYLGLFLGTIYVTKNWEIGVFILRKYKNKGIADRALTLLLDEVLPNQKEFYANVNPNNKASVSFFKKRGFKIVQHTYKLERD